jgi:ribosomal protein L33
MNNKKNKTPINEDMINIKRMLQKELSKQKYPDHIVYNQGIISYIINHPTIPIEYAIKCYEFISTNTNKSLYEKITTHIEVFNYSTQHNQSQSMNLLSLEKYDSMRSQKEGILMYLIDINYDVNKITCRHMVDYIYQLLQYLPSDGMIEDICDVWEYKNTVILNEIDLSNEVLHSFETHITKEINSGDVLYEYIKQHKTPNRAFHWFMRRVMDCEDLIDNIQMRKYSEVITKEIFDELMLTCQHR